MHACCWEVARDVINSPCSDQNWLSIFACHLFRLQHFAEKPIFECETHDVDHELLAETLPAIRGEDTNEEDVNRIIPPAFFEGVFRLLDQNSHTIHLDQVEKFDRCLAHWLRKGTPYSLRHNINMNVRPEIKKIVQNLRSSDASRSPKTYNLRVAWNNVQAVLDAMRNTPLPRPLPWDPQLRVPKYMTKFCIPAEKCHKLTLSFSDRMVFFPKAGTIRYLSGFGYDGKYIGWYSSAHSGYYLEVKSLRGVHWAKDSSGAIPALKFKDGQEWTEWYGVPASGIDDCEIAWDTVIFEISFTFNLSLFISRGPT